MKRAICADPHDNVATLVEHAEAGEEVLVESSGEPVRVRLRMPVAIFHKFALRDIAPGETVMKYGEAIGKATSEIKAGEHVHIHNVESSRGRGDRKGVPA